RLRDSAGPAGPCPDRGPVLRRELLGRIGGHGSLCAGRLGDGDRLLSGGLHSFVSPGRTGRDRRPTGRLAGPPAPDAAPAVVAAAARRHFRGALRDAGRGRDAILGTANLSAGG